jgi:hypothetical protein
VKTNDMRWGYRSHRTDAQKIPVGQSGEGRPLEATGADENINFNRKEIVR